MWKDAGGMTSLRRWHTRTAQSVMLFVYKISFHFSFLMNYYYYFIIFFLNLAIYSFVHFVNSSICSVYLFIHLFTYLLNLIIIMMTIFIYLLSYRQTSGLSCILYTQLKIIFVYTTVCFFVNLSVYLFVSLFSLIY